ncbi:histone PARylation factor 1 isoform X5 [Phyllopteryx taeniolatus]|uniref:histone PARylation factor 1 isoform X5 n=1 Tax=Phyllopteryx taeniolatus TaxID=161469 RepID=UPI002AD510F0|nr:histone PARylation factor 1 isoform X5 [Phyllopteryx taeniolatus]
MTGRAKRKPKSLQESGEGNGEVKKVRPDDVKATRPSEASPQRRDEMLRLYKLHMPEDLYHFWDFCEEIHPDNPCGALQDTLGLQLVGPFEVLAGAHRNCKNASPNFHLHWRYFYDPPEFQTILQGSQESQHHMGYYSLFLRRKKKEKGRRKTGEEDLERLETKLNERAETLNLSLEQRTKSMKQRDKKVVTKTFHGAGIVVPVDKNDVGYRELPETDAALKKICKAIAEAQNDDERVKAFRPLQEMITFVQFANDECDYGMGYELGVDLFCFGSHVSRVASSMHAADICYQATLTLLPSVMFCSFNIDDRDKFPSNLGHCLLSPK